MSNSSSALFLIWITSQNSFRRIFRSERNAGALLPLNLSGFVICIAVVACIAVVMLFIDVWILRLSRTAPNDVVTFFQYVTKLGSTTWILVGSIVLATVFAATDWAQTSPRKKVRLANYHADMVFTFSCVAITGVLASLIKNTIGRARPKHLDTLGHLEFDFAAFTSSFASFPSGHSTTFGAFCMCLALLWPRFWPVWLIAAILGGISRVFVGAHYPSDVMAGLLFGAAGTIVIARYLARRGLMFSSFQGYIPKRKKF